LVFLPHLIFGDSTPEPCVLQSTIARYGGAVTA
jgi:hypothetical protein